MLTGKTKGHEKYPDRIYRECIPLGRENNVLLIIKININPASKCYGFQLK
jgi:hypothetical protein